MINIACGQALFRPFFGRTKHEAGVERETRASAPSPVARVWRSLLASRLPLLVLQATINTAAEYKN